MKSFNEWALPARIGTVAAGLGLIAATLSNLQTIADAQPLATKSFVIAQTTLATQSFQDLRWDAAIDRLANLKFQLSQQRVQALQLSDQIQADPTPDVLKRQVLDELRTDIVSKEKQIERLQCQVDNRFGNTTC